MAIHPTAIVDSAAELDPSVEVGPFCIIEGHVRVGAGVRLYHGVYLTGWTDIGEACELHPGVIVGHAPQDTKYGGERSYCRIGARTILREHVTIHRGTIPDSETVVGEDCLLLAGSHVAHNCRVGDHVTLINDVLLGGHVQVDRAATLGGGAGIHQFVRIGELVMVAGQARVTQDIVPYALVDSHGRVAGLNRVGMRRAGMPREQLDDIREAYRVLFTRGLPREAALKQLSCEPRSPARERLLAFLRAESKRGLAGRARARPYPAAPSEGD